MAKTEKATPKKTVAKKTTAEKSATVKAKVAAAKNEQVEVNDVPSDIPSGDEAVEITGVDLSGSQTDGSENEAACDGEGASVQDRLAAEKEKYLRLAAEYDNFRKRSAKERELTYSDARIDAITKLLPVYDNLERALQMECADEAFYKGIEMIMTQFNDMFEGMNIKHIPAVGEPFDPKLHNAVMMIADPNLGENTVAEEYQKGFTLGDRVLRFSTVVVAN